MDVGYGEVEYGLFEVVDFVVCFGGVEYLIKDYCVYCYECVVFGDDFLVGYVEDLFYYVDFVVNMVNVGNDEVEFGFECVLEFVEVFLCLFVVLWYVFDVC